MRNDNNKPQREMKRCPSASPAITAILFLFVVLPSVTWANPVPIMFSGMYSQDFNSLTASGSGSSLPVGWYFHETGDNANSTYAAGTGSSTTGNTYSFGSSGSFDRALGGLRSGSLVPVFGAAFQNATPDSITRLQVSYIGEQWRRGSSSGDSLDFQYSLDATSLTDGNWIDVPALDFVAPVTTGSGRALDGNDAGNRIAIANLITGLFWSSGATLWVRWNDFPVISGSNDGLSVDDFYVKAIAEPGSRSSVPETLPIWWPTLALGSVLILARRSSQRSIY